MDFNGKNINDEYYTDKPEIKNEFDLFLQELDVLFNTKEETVLGDLDYGLRLGRFLWNTDNNDRFLASYVKRKINNSCYFADNFEVDVNMKIMKGEKRDIGVVDIKIKGGQDNINRNIEYVLR